MSEQYELTINELIAKIRRYENQIEALRTEIEQDSVMMGACRDAINDLRKHVEKLEKENEPPSTRPETCEGCIFKPFKQFQPEQRWIPVSERVPRNDDFVIVTILDEHGDGSYRYSDFGWYLDAANCWIVDAEQRSDIVAWMSLPEPWKGD